jgi:hypothetical protein
MSMSKHYLVQRDTEAWRAQVWIFFAVALLASAIGVVQLPGEQLDRAFLAIGFFFCLFASFSVAKTVRDNRDGDVDTTAWRSLVWIAFFAAVALTGWGLWRMQITAWHKGAMVVSWLFLVSSTFSLAKTVRDRHEADLIERGGASTDLA